MIDYNETPSQADIKWMDSKYTYSRDRLFSLIRAYYL